MIPVSFLKFVDSLLLPINKAFEISPVIGDGVDYAKGSYDSEYGKVSVSWKKVNDKVSFDIEVPVNTKATFIYNKQTKELEPGLYKLSF